MRLNRGHALGIATLSGFAIASCNLALGLGGYDFEHGSGGATSSTTTSSSGSSSGGGSSSSGTGAGGMNDGGPDGDAQSDADAGPEPGYTMWAQGFGDPASDETVNAVAVGGPDDHIFITGRADVPTTFGCAAADAGATTGYLVELDPDDGHCLWSYFFGADAEGTAVTVDGNGNIVLAGTFHGQLAVDPTWNMTAAGTDSFLARFDVTRSLKWVRRVGETGGTGDQKITALSMNATEIAAAGTYDKVTIRISGPNISNIDLGSSPEGIDAFVLLFTMNGDYQQILSISSPSGMQPQSATGVGVRATDGAFAVVGNTMGPTRFNGDQVNTGFDPSMFLGAYDASKTTLFKMILGDDSPQYGQGAAFDNAGDIVVAGDFLGTIYALGQNSDAGASIANEGGTDVFLARYHDDGTPADILQLGLDPQGSNNATVGGLAIYENATDMAKKHISLAGGFSGTFGVMGVSSPVSSMGNDDVYVAKVDFNLGGAAWVKSFGDNADQLATAVAVDREGNTIVVGHYQGTIDFGEPGTKFVNAGAGVNDIFIAKLAP